MADLTLIVPPMGSEAAERVAADLRSMVGSRWQGHPSCGARTCGAVRYLPHARRERVAS